MATPTANPVATHLDWSKSGWSKSGRSKSGTASADALFGSVPGGRKYRLTWWSAVGMGAVVGAAFVIPKVAAVEVVRYGWQHFLVELAGASLPMACGTLVALARIRWHHRQFVETMAKALDARDPYTAGHSSRVADYSRAIAQAMGLSRRKVRTLGVAAELHDIGKIGIPDAVLQKPGRLTAEEIGLIRLHPQIGCRILEKTGQFEKLLPVVELHHENWDGTGYPYGFRGENVPLEARIVHVADAFDAMTSARCYRTAPPLEFALGELKRCAGTQFDPRVAAVFLTLLDHGVFDALLNGTTSVPFYTSDPATAPAPQRNPAEQRTVIGAGR